MSFRHVPPLHWTSSHYPCTSRPYSFGLLLLLQNVPAKFVIQHMPPIFRSYFVVCRKNTLATIWKQVGLVQLYRVLQSYAENTLATICKQIGFCHFTTKSETSLPFTTINMTSYLIGYTFDVTSCSLPHTWIIFFKYFSFRALTNFRPSNISTK
jgi:hypothetical protein